MAYDLRLLAFILFFACTFHGYTIMARPILTPKSSFSLISRLKLDEENTDCWDTLIQLQACTGEIILFFLNGETDLGHRCCEAIRSISAQCWPNMIDTLGFTTEEGNILEGYCDENTSDGSSKPPPSPQSLTPPVKFAFSTSSSVP